MASQDDDLVWPFELTPQDMQVLHALVAELRVQLHPLNTTNVVTFSVETYIQVYEMDYAETGIDWLLDQFRNITGQACIAVRDATNLGRFFIGPRSVFPYNQIARINNILTFYPSAVHTFHPLPDGSFIPQTVSNFPNTAETLRDYIAVKRAQLERDTQAVLQYTADYNNYHNTNEQRGLVQQMNQVYLEARDPAQANPVMPQQPARQAPQQAQLIIHQPHPVVQQPYAVVPAPQLIQHNIQPPAAHANARGAHERIKRPGNAFILYRKDHHSLIKAERPSAHNNEISIILGARWKGESAAVKEYYKALAQKGKDALLIKHPDYRYSPRRPTQISRRNTRNGHASSDPRGFDHAQVSENNQDDTATNGNDEEDEDVEAEHSSADGDA